MSGPRLRRWRRGRGWSAYWLAEILGVQPTTVYGWEHEQWTPPDVMRARLHNLTRGAVPAAGWRRPRNARSAPDLHPRLETADIRAAKRKVQELERAGFRRRRDYAPLRRLEYSLREFAGPRWRIRWNPPEADA